MSATFLPQIENVVLLMLENRSLDNVLGWLYQGHHPQHVYPEGSSPAYDGLAPGKFHNPSYHWLGGVHHYPVVPVPDDLWSMNKDRVPAYDPNEDFRANHAWNGVMNQLFGNQDRIKRLPDSKQRAEMLGFLQDYYADYMFTWKGLDILWTYTPKQLRVINGLAKQYAVSDAWFCSVPSQTNPNRAYSLCGTSLGRESNLRLNAVEQFDVPTIFNGVANAGKSWGLYYTDVWHSRRSYTEYTFPQITKAPKGDRGDMKRFEYLARTGDLPAFTYLEPKWGYGKGEFFVQGTDFHPPTHTIPGDHFLHKVYKALSTGKNWDKTLLIVTFDEHGGTYDHVRPAWTATPPDDLRGKDGFKFDLFGVRVPTLLISPYVAQGTVFRAPAESKVPFDHTSLIKTILKWADVDPHSVNMGRRMPLAPTFEGVLSPSIVNQGTVDLRRLESGLDTPNVESGPAGSGQPLNALFEGIPFASTRAILNASKTLTDVLDGIANYKLDPGRFEADLIGDSD